MNAERLSRLALVGIAGIAAHQLSKTAFAISTRKEIGERDRWTCQGNDGEPCIWETIKGEPASWHQEYMVTASHYPETHNGDKDTNPENGRITCIVCHVCEEVDRGNVGGATLLAGKFGLYNVHHDHQVELTVDYCLSLRQMAVEKTEFREHPNGRRSGHPANGNS